MDNVMMFFLGIDFFFILNDCIMFYLDVVFKGLLAKEDFLTQFEFYYNLKCGNRIMKGRFFSFTFLRDFFGFGILVK